MPPATVHIRLYSILRKFAQEHGYDGHFTLQVEDGTTLEQIRERIGIPPRWVSRYLKEAKPLSPDYVVQEGDVIDFLPPTIGGG